MLRGTIGKKKKLITEILCKFPDLKKEKYSNSNQSKLFYFLYRGIFYSIILENLRQQRVTHVYSQMQKEFNF